MAALGVASIVVFLLPHLIGFGRRILAQFVATTFQSCPELRNSSQQTPPVPVSGSRVAPSNVPTPQELEGRATEGLPVVSLHQSATPCGHDLLHAVGELRGVDEIL